MRVEQVFITPLIKEDTYGTEIEVSDFVKIDGLSKIKKSIDSTNYSIGVYRFNDLRLKCENAQGTFNENDSRSVFPFTRDRAKVRVVALEINPVTFVTIAKTQFEGIINDEATRQNITNDVITFVALSKDSVFRTTQVQTGIIAVGSSVFDAIISILSQADIISILTIDPVNIIPAFEFAIDKPEQLDNLEVKEALDLLVFASGSVLILKNDTVFVQGRENPGLTEADALILRGRGEISNNANIISISAFNTGKQRQFNSIILNKTVTITDDDNVFEFGLRQAEFDLPMVGNIQTLQGIAQNIADEFKNPKIELKLRVATSVSEDKDLLDLVRVDAPWLKKPLPGNFLPVYGVATYGDIITPYPQIQGSIQILNNIKFKIISIEDDPKSFITTLKLRQSGKNTNDGTFFVLPPALYGTAVYGTSQYGVV